MFNSFIKYYFTVIRYLGSGRIYPGARFLRIFTVAFLLFLTISGQSLPFNYPNLTYQIYCENQRNPAPGLIRLDPLFGFPYAVRNSVAKVSFHFHYLVKHLI